MVSECTLKNAENTVYLESLLSISIGVNEDLVSEVEGWNVHTA